MPTRSASATWEGGLKGGSGSFRGESGTVGGSYSAGSRFGGDRGTNPEELLAAAEASCFSMALSGAIERAGAAPERIHTEADCSIEKEGDGWRISTLRLRVRARVPGMDAEAFRRAAEETRVGCPVSRALAGVEISVEAELE